MGIEFWDSSNCRVVNHRNYKILLPNGKLEHSEGFLSGDERCVDYRMYLLRLMRKYIARDGEIKYRLPTAANFHELYDQHDTLAIGTGKKHDGFADFFPTINELTKHDTPPRNICAGLYEGVTAPLPFAVTVNVSVGHGELIELPIETRVSPRAAVLIEGPPEGDLAHLMNLNYSDDPAAFHHEIFRTLENHFPNVASRTDKSALALIGEDSLLQGNFQPVTRKYWAEISDGKFAMAIGDLKCTMDPLTGQGANLASYGACVLGDQVIANNGNIDRDFCETYDAAIHYRVEGVVGFNNELLDPAEHTRRLLHAMPHNRALCDDFSARFARPESIWHKIFKDAEICGAHLSKFEPALAADAS
ncbi:MAG: styrene monooxygenase/indole monooxygenase family protein [Pseudomonadota bacterium]